METESIDKLFLELSQVTKAKTRNDMKLERLMGLVLGVESPMTSVTISDEQLKIWAAFVKDFPDELIDQNN